MPETVEGQEIALAILSGGPRSAWAAFMERYQPRLTRQAEGIVKRMPTLRSLVQEEDLVQGFLADQVMGRPEVMLGPTAAGQKPLWPRLSRSFGNYCSQILRHLAREPKSVSDEAIEARAVTDSGGPEDRDDTLVSIVQRVHEQQDAIRRAFREHEPGTIPLMHLLLLSERLFLARQIETSFADAHPGQILEVPIPEMCSRIAPWEPGEQEQALPPGDMALGQSWDTLTSPVLLTDGDAISRVLGVRRNTWDQWIHRARQHVLSEVGSERCRMLFPRWPQRSGAKTYRVPRERGGS